MPSHDIIDNRNIKLLDNINRILASTKKARFAVGYFFLSGFESIAKKLRNVDELRLLIGNISNRETLEQIAEGYARLELVEDAAEEQKYPKRTESRRRSHETAENIKISMELMDQSDENEELVKTLVQMIEEKRIKVKVYTKGRLHAKAYIFDYGKVYDNTGKPVDRIEKGIAVVGSSNLTLSGVTHNTELNVVVHGNDNHAELVRWFDELWNESVDFDESLLQEMKESWAVVQATPYDIYMKTLYALVRDRLESEEKRDILWEDEITKDLADFQKVAVRQAIGIIKDYDGVFIADVVGLGKSFIGAAIIKHFERTTHARPLIICPAPLTDMWDLYNETYQLNARIMSMGLLRENDNGDLNVLLDDKRYRDRDFVLIDESHNFRHPDTQRYKILQSFLSVGKKTCFLTATPRNKSSWDIYNQIKLFHHDEITNLPVDPPNLREYFKQIDKGFKTLQNLLYHLQIRRLRKHVLMWYGYAADTHKPLREMSEEEVKPYIIESRKAYINVGGKRNYFPKRELETVEYSIEDTYQGLYRELRSYLGKYHRSQPIKPRKDELTYARYGLWHYVKKEKQQKEPYRSMHRAGINLRGLMRVLLFKRFESSVYAFSETIKRLIKVHESFMNVLNEGIIPAGEDAQNILYESDFDSETDFVNEIRKVSKRYNIDDFDAERLKEHINHDIRLLYKIKSLVEPITPPKDSKLNRLKKLLENHILGKGKVIIFTQFADTARYIYDNVNYYFGNKIEVIFSSDKSKTKIVGRFAPRSNPEYKFQKGETELDTLVSTDVLAEGLNLQDCDKIINYDLHWNPVKLIQRFGRIDRIGSEYEIIYGYNFLPETGIEKNLGLKQKLKNRIQEIHDTIGEDAAILDTSERLNEETMYAIYEQKGGQLTMFEEDEDIIDLNEAEEFFRQLRRDNPDEFERIANLRDGIRSSKFSEEKGIYVFCQAEKYQQLFFTNKNNEIISRDISNILKKIKCGKKEQSADFPAKYNESVMKVKQVFSEEVKHRESEKDHSLYLSLGQKYVLKELRLYFSHEADDDEKVQINLLEKAFRSRITNAVRKELNYLRRNGVAGKDLYRSLSKIYHEHQLQRILDTKQDSEKGESIPRIICSEGLV